jgi:hypothetical protein
VVTSVKVHLDGHVFVPETPVDLPVGTVLEIPIHSSASSEKPKSTLAQLAEIARQITDNPHSPPDLAQQHDHYLYGTPKRS